MRTVCRLPRIRRFSEARLNRYSFEDYLQRLAARGATDAPVRCRRDEGAVIAEVRAEAGCRVGRVYRVSVLWESRGIGERHSAQELSLVCVVENNSVKKGRCRVRKHRLIGSVGALLSWLLVSVEMIYLTLQLMNGQT